ncbi:MAG: hypothetical protein H5T46_05570 [Archaeoglobi archaeon]|nr:hypothetical protein [Candidatus Mnemosynella sp.]
MPKVVYEEYELLNGERKELVKQVGDGSIIKRFDKTPLPEKNTDVVCPHFLELKWANGCNFDCAWCYLNGTFRFRPFKKKPYLKDEKKILQHLDLLFRNSNGEVELLNSGELSDSLVFEGNGFSLSGNIIPLFKKYRKHKLLIVTKSANVEGILESGAQDVVVVSFSLNAYPVAEKWERKAPHPRERIRAAKKLFDAGYTVRFRIDPMVPVEGWKEHYLHLVDEIFSNLTPERITLGSLRGLQSTINNCRDASWTKYLTETSNWGKKIDHATRLKMYRTVIGYLKESYGFENVALCKETVAIWNDLGMDYRRMRCNCVI